MESIKQLDGLIVYLTRKDVSEEIISQVRYAVNQMIDEAFREGKEFERKMSAPAHKRSKPAEYPNVDESHYIEQQQAFYEKVNQEKEDNFNRFTD